MTFPTYEPHPSLTLPVTPEQRARAHDLLHDAFAAGRLDRAELDERLGQVAAARDRHDLNAAFLGLVAVPAVASEPVASPAPATHEDPTARAIAVIGHLSVLVAWLIGPLVVFAATQRGTFQRREAAKAFNFQFVMFLGFVGLGAAAALTHGHLGALIGLYTVAWLVLTVVGAIKAGQGEDWRNPVERIAHWQVLREA